MRIKFGGIMSCSCASSELKTRAALNGGGEEVFALEGLLRLNTGRMREIEIRVEKKSELDWRLKLVTAKKDF
jgi:hypothetical protein